MEKLKAASLFSGSGGMDLGMMGGFEFLGRKYSKNPIEIVYAVDNDKYACEIFNKNFDVECVNKDIKEVKFTEIPPHHILAGGFPCQSFSIVAQNPPRLGYKDEKGRLFFEMCRILKERKPLCFIAENVKGILSANKGAAFPLILKNFEDASYHIKYDVLDASDYGVPQKRERVFIVGFRDSDILKNFDFPRSTTSTNKVPLSKVLLPEDQVDPKYYFSEKAVNGMKKVKEKMNKGRVQNPDEPCNTIGAHLAKVSLNSVDPVLKLNGRYRRFTPREAARIQSFPDSFVLSGAEGRQYRAIGNAVPPVLMWYVTREIIKAIKKTGKMASYGRQRGH
jgi:DNA (cytosine-5)-methyltransferase 1